MSKAIWFISYKLKKGVSVPDFLAASEKTHNEVLSKKKGFISWEVLLDDDTWVDYIIWETMEDAKNAESDGGEPNPIALEFYSYINMNSCKSRLYSIQKSY